MSARYQIEVSWSNEDHAWIADVPDLAFCSAHGPTAHEAVAEVASTLPRLGFRQQTRLDGPSPSHPVAVSSA